MNYPTELEVMPEAIEVLKRSERPDGTFYFRNCDNFLLKGQITQAKETLKEISRQIVILSMVKMNILLDDDIQEEINSIHKGLKEQIRKEIEKLNQRKKQYEVSIKFLEEQVNT